MDFQAGFFALFACIYGAGAPESAVAKMAKGRQ
jgi:hypothetical protein